MFRNRHLPTANVISIINVDKLVFVLNYLVVVPTLVTAKDT